MCADHPGAREILCTEMYADKFFYRVALYALKEKTTKTNDHHAVTHKATKKNKSHDYHTITQKKAMTILQSHIKQQLIVQTHTCSCSCTLATLTFLL